jgi:hypothetical protein
MATARRLYLYIVSGIGLGLILSAGTTLLGLVLDRLGIHAVDPFSSGPFPVATGSAPLNREALAGAIGLMAVGLPLWLIHWGLVERTVRRNGPEAEAERQSQMRSLFFAIVLGSLLVIAASAAVDALREGISRPLGATDPFVYVDIAGSVATAVVVGGAWGYHVWVRARDLRRGPAIRGSAAWISRLYLYGAAFAGLVAVLAATAAMINTVIDVVAGYQGSAFYDGGLQLPGEVGSMGLTVPTAAWWVRPVIAAGATILIWGWVWSGHWLYAGRLRARGDEQGQSERSSRLRLSFFVGVVAVGVGLATTAFGDGLGVLIGAVIGAPRSGAGLPVWHDVIGPPAAAVFAIVAWWAHRRFATREQAEVEDGSALRAVRPMDYMTALIGLGFLTVGLVGLLTLLVQQTMGETLYGAGILGSWRDQAARDIGYAVVGVPVLLWPWLASRRRLAVDRAGEVRSSSRRYCLFFVVGASVVAGAGSLAIVVTQVARVAVGLDSSGFGSSVAYPLAILAVAAAVVVIFGAILYRDMTGGAGAPSEAGAGAIEAPVGAPWQPPQTETRRGLEIVIGGPENSDMEPLRAWLAATLPPGYSLAVRPVGETNGS